jgi:predicted amidohydrolase YtcJ
MFSRLCVLLVAAAVAAGCGNAKIKADLIVHHARIYTVDSAFTITEAMAVKDGKILATGANDKILNAYSADSVTDAGGKAMYPGFIDAHAHFLGYGRGLFEVGLYECANWDDAVARIDDFGKKHPAEPWIRGRGWDQNAWPGKNYPDNAAINKLYPTRPILLQRVDGHAAIANAEALRLAGITPDTKISGGEIEVKNGQLTGLLIDNAVDLVTKIIPAPTQADYTKWLTTAQKNCFAQGLTTVADCGLMHYEVAMIDTLQRQDVLQMRLYVLLTDDTANYRRYLPGGPYKTDRLYIKGIKAYADGALGSRGACLLHPYNDKPGSYGFLLSPQSHFDSLAKMLLASDFQLCTHAIGDSGNRMVLGIYSKYLTPGNDRRWRIEHAQIVNPADFDAFGKSAIIPSVQPTHATSDMLWAVDRIGPDRLKGGYAYQQLLQQNGWLPLGTDFPVEDISPLKTFYAAVVRKDAKGRPDNGFQTENALTRLQALRGMTIWAAKGCFLERETGSLEPGKKADFIIVDKDLMNVAESELLGVKVLGTWVGGRKVW